MTWDELVAEVTVRHPLRRRQSQHPRVHAGSVEPTPAEESKMYGVPCLERENGKVVACFWKDGGLAVKLTDEAQRERALALPGAAYFDPAAKPPVRDSGPVEGVRGNREVSPTSTSPLPAAQSAEWEGLVDQALG